jgi:hypothetical protein
VFWDAKEVLLLDFLVQGRGQGERRSINAKRYCETLTQLKNAIHRRDLAFSQQESSFCMTVPHGSSKSQ